MRHDERQADELRPITIIPHFTKHPEGSVLISMGDTKVICNASVENRVPHFLRGQDKGWVTAEYAMLPRATEQRNIRESAKGRLSGRTMEIQRLIGRALRSVIQLEHLGERTLWLDCDVIQADGGTRTAAITGAFVASALAFHKLLEEGTIEKMPLTDFLAAVSVGVLANGHEVLDLDYHEDFEAKVDMNVVMTGSLEFIEIQGTGEEATFTQSQLQTMLSLAQTGIKNILDVQRKTLGDIAKMIDDQSNER